MIRNQLPNAITLINLLAGCMMMVCMIIDANEWVLVWLVIGLSADFLDGALARWLEASSVIGAQLDSLADLITFGLAPSFVLFYWFWSERAMVNFSVVWLMVLLFIPACSAIRLARFNAQNDRADHFQGLPTPANGLLLIGLWLQLKNGEAFAKMAITHPLFITAFALLDGYLLISHLPFFSFKFKNWNLENNWYRYGMVLISGLLFLIIGWEATAIIVLLYITLSVILSIIRVIN